LPGPISATVVISGPEPITFPGGVTSTEVTVGFPQKGMIAKLAPSPTETIRVTEGFSLAWKYRNIENTLYVSPDQNDPTQTQNDRRLPDAGGARQADPIIEIVSVERAVPRNVGGERTRFGEGSDQTHGANAEAKRTRRKPPELDVA
jgi:hypothetical protein